MQADKKHEDYGSDLKLRIIYLSVKIIKCQAANTGIEVKRRNLFYPPIWLLSTTLTGSTICCQAISFHYCKCLASSMNEAKTASSVFLSVLAPNATTLTFLPHFFDIFALPTQLPRSRDSMGIFHLQMGVGGGVKVVMSSRGVAETDEWAMNLAR
nr:hypothetical protein Iba_chr07aCG10230 [Ipomoea batatas]